MRYRFFLKVAKTIDIEIGQNRMLGAGVPMSRVRPELTSIRPLAKGCRTGVCAVPDKTFD